MYITELFPKSKVNRIVLTDLPKDTARITGLMQRLAKFHNINLAYEKGEWTADDTAGVNPFLKDVTYLLSAAGIATSMQEDDDNNDIERKLIAIFRKGPTLENPKAAASKIYLWKTGPGDRNYEMEVGQDRKRIPVTLSFDQIRDVLAKKGFNESILKAGRLLIEASMTKSVPSKKESVFHKGVEKLLGQQVAVVVVDHPDSVAYGTFKRIGETGLCHIKLNGGKLPNNWAAGDMIAVRPSEVYAPWDTRLQGMTAVHREYGDTGEKTVREGLKDPRSDLDKQIEFHQLGLANAQYKGPMATYHKKNLRRLFALQKNLETPVQEGESDPRKKYPNSLFPEKTAENKRAAALKRLKDREWRKIKGDTGGGDSNIGSPQGGDTSTNDY